MGKNSKIKENPSPVEGRGGWCSYCMDTLTGYLADFTLDIQFNVRDQAFQGIGFGAKTAFAITGSEDEVPFPVFYPDSF